MAREVDAGKQKIAELLGDRHARRARCFRRRGVAQLVHFLDHLVEHRGGCRPVEAHTGRALLQLLGAQQGGEGQSNPVQHAGPAPFRRRVGLAFGGLLGLPGPRLRRRGHACVRVVGVEDVGMAANHLVRDAARDRVEIEAAVLPRHLGVEDDLEEQVAEFVPQRRPIALADRFGHLVGLLDRVGRDGLETLLQIPRATAIRIAQPGHDLQQPVDAGPLIPVVASRARCRRIGHRSHTIANGEIIVGDLPGSGGLVCAAR